MLTIDYREVDLRNALEDVQHQTRSLPIGDVLCEYADARAPWIAERKRASDLATCLKNGRLSEQTARLYEAGCHSIFPIVFNVRNIPSQFQFGSCGNPCHYIFKSVFQRPKTSRIHAWIANARAPDAYNFIWKNVGTFHPSLMGRLVIIRFSGSSKAISASESSNWKGS